MTQGVQGEGVNYLVTMSLKPWYTETPDDGVRGIKNCRKLRDLIYGQPHTCSYFIPGLIILSRHPIEEVEFIPFSKRGNFWSFDGEVFVGKGLGRAR